MRQKPATSGHTQRRMPLPRWQRWGIYGLSTALLLTGLVWLCLESFVRIEGVFGPEHSPWQQRLLMAHGTLALPMLWLVGVLWSAHVQRAWVAGKNRVTGGLMLAIVALLALTAAQLYYLADERWRALASLGHWLVGLSMMVALPLHIWRGRRGAQVVV
jgi:hypothetical protein